MLPIGTIQDLPKPGGSPAVLSIGRCQLNQLAVFYAPGPYVEQREERQRSGGMVQGNFNGAELVAKPFVLYAGTIGTRRAN